jgi:Spy/CpxP family protein refolding chaperone
MEMTMKVNQVIRFVTMLLACLSLWAHPAQTDPLSENLFPPELVIQHGEAIGLTQEQKDFLQTQMHKVQDRFAEMHQKLQKEVEAVAALLKQEQVDEAAALAQFDKVLNQEREIKPANLALVLAIRNKLTHQQQAKLREIKRQLASGTPQWPHQAKILEAKLDKVKTGVEKWQNEGRDPSPIAEIMQEFEPLMKAGKVKEAEALLEKALKLLDESKEGKRESSQSRRE